MTKSETPHTVQCPVCKRWFAPLVTGVIRWHGDKIHYPPRACLGYHQKPAAVVVD